VHKCVCSMPDVMPDVIYKTVGLLSDKHCVSEATPMQPSK
jgi:hypothetical protein